MATLYTFNNKLVKINNKFIQKYVEPEPPTPPGPTFDEVTIGNQIWMSKNLAIDDGQGGIYTRTVNYGQGDVVEHYYTWEAAVRVAASITGWHFPTNDEWNTLASTIGGASVAGNKLKSTYGWEYDYDHDRSGGGTDEYGFGAFPAGYYVNEYGDYSQVRDSAKFWTANNFSTTEGLGKQMNSTSYSMSYDYYQKLDALTVRLIKDS